ncbi:Protein S-acyltransferase [Bertholletia excelsa]
MRRHGWQLPYHPLQVVAVAVFLALGFAFYVFFAPFVGRKLFQYIAIGVYTPLITCAFGLYIWCAASDPADPGVFKSKKYIRTPDTKQHAGSKESKHSGELASSIQDADAIRGKPLDEGLKDVGMGTEDCTTKTEKNASAYHSSCFAAFLAFIPCAFLCNCSSPHNESSEQQLSEDGMFYCSLCEVEVFKYSKHCRVCDKCVDRFDHHCRWLNNCIGKRNYRQFFTLMVSALLLLIFQWSTGIYVMISCFVERKRFSVDIATKLGSSFTMAPFAVVVVVCTILAMIATLPLAQLFFFHILLVKKGISTYDYIIALRDQEQQGIGGQQSPQMSIVSSLTGLSSASSFNTFNRGRGAWCTPPRLFVEDQFDVVPTDTGSVSSLGKKSQKTMPEEPIKKKKAVKISPWQLARLNAEEVSRAAAEARKNSKILKPVLRQEEAPFSLEMKSHFGSSSSRQMVPKPDNSRRRGSKRIRLPADVPFGLESLTQASATTAFGNENGLLPETSSSLVPLRLEARSAFRTTAGVASSPESSFASPEVHPFQASTAGTDMAQRLTGLSAATAPAQDGICLSRSTSDGYEASGGEDSDRVPTRIVQRSARWDNHVFTSSQDERVVARLKASASSSQASRNI